MDRGRQDPINLDGDRRATQHLEPLGRGLGRRIDRHQWGRRKPLASVLAMLVPNLILAAGASGPGITYVAALAQGGAGAEILMPATKSSIVFFMR